MTGLSLKLTNQLVVAAFLIILIIFSSSASVDWFEGFSWHDQQRIFQLILLCVTLIAIWVLPVSQIPGWALALMVLIFILGLISSLMSQWPVWALREWGRYIGLVILALLVGDIAKFDWGRRFFIIALAVAACLSAYQFIVFYLIDFVSGIRMLDANMLFHGFSNPRFLGQFQVLLMPLVAWLILCSWQSERRYSALLAAVFVGVLALHWCLVVGLAGRGVLLSLIVPHLVLIVVAPRFYNLLLVQLFSALVGLLLFYILFHAVPDWFGYEAILRDIGRTGLSKRDELWSLAWQVSLGAPWLGVGPMHFAANAGGIAAHPHQVVLQWLAEWGWPATLCAILMFGIGMAYALIFLRRWTADNLNAALWLSISAALVLAQVSGVFVMPYTETWLSVLVGVAIAYYRIDSDRCDSPRMRKVQMGTWRLLSIPAFIILIQVMITGVPTLQQDIGAFLEEHETGKQPRFWVQGWIPMND